ncbi:DUF1731 domain-containing protein, partial [Mycobacteroides abscessus subsp. abscessus]|uniref:DUF1731 domain-containing protein n=1 Tax=Mycobacteroides abscessus TaxID=36809 RepID=UPI0039EF66B1
PPRLAPPPHGAWGAPPPPPPPAPVTNAEFTAALGRVLHRPTLLVAPQFALSLIFGEFADAELTSSMRVIPAVLEQHGFEFEHHTIGEALAYANNSRPMK